MTQLHPQKTGLTLGLFVGGGHLVWAILVALGWAQPLFNFILWAHMLHLPLTIGPFALWPATVLVVITFMIGYAFGFVFAALWNVLHRRA